MSNLSELPLHLLIEVAERIKKFEDFVAFRMVCKTWAAAGKKEYFKGLWLRPGIPYLLLPSTDHVNDVREFYSLVDCEIVASVTISTKFKKRKCHESLGWLLAVEEDGIMYLLNPFSSVEIPVPHQTTFPGYVSSSIDALIFVKKFVLSARPIETFDFIVMIICNSPSCLAFWKPGDESWNIIDIGHGTYTDVIYHGGHFYAVDYNGYAWVFTLHKDNLPEGRIVTRLIANVPNNFHVRDIVNELVDFKNLYILKTSLSLFIITRKAYWYDNEKGRWSYKTSKFQVYEVDVSTGMWAEVYDIGNMAIFVGHNSTFAIDPSRMLGNLEVNHIYFSDDGWISYHVNGGGKDMGVYNLASRTIRPFYGCEVLLTKICPSVWITKWF